MVITLSSTYSPVPSDFGVDAQPVTVIRVRANTNAGITLNKYFIKKSPNNVLKI